jgi:putative ubiquitin-RnfH superfamily antitoxin RatB of RatAB toxin-antitoxin module
LRGRDFHRQNSVRAITVTVVYALPDTATEVAVQLPEGATVADALARANLPAAPDGADLAACPVGIFGQRTRRDTVLADGDRVELYRPLSADAKQARRRRAADKKR